MVFILSVVEEELHLPLLASKMALTKAVTREFCRVLCLIPMKVGCHVLPLTLLHEVTDPFLGGQ